MKKLNAFNKTFILLVLLTFGAANQAIASGSYSVQETLDLSKELRYSAFSLISSETQSAQDGGGRISTYNFITASLRYGLDKRIAFRLPFTFGTYGFDEFNGNTNQEQELELQDVFMSLSDYNLVLLPGDIGVFWEGRVYAPTSKFSRKSKMIARLRNDFILTKYLPGGFITEYVTKANYYHQSQTAYLNEFEGGDGFPVSINSATKSFSHDSWFNLWYPITGDFALGAQYGWEDTYYNKSDVLDIDKPAKHEIKAGPSIRFAAGSRANFILNFTDKVDNAENRGELGQFKAENTELVLLAFIRL